MNYVKAIRIGRAVRGFTQAGLARCLGVDGSYISMVERGERRPTPDMIGRIARALDLRDELFLFLAAEPEELAFSKRNTPHLHKRLAAELLDLIAAAKA